MIQAEVDIENALATTGRSESLFRGISASQGVAHGPAFVFFQREFDVPLYKVDEKDFEGEIKRLDVAIAKTREEILRIRTKVSQTLGELEAQIFDAHLLVLEDKALIDGAIRELKETSYNIDYCFHLLSKRYVDAFEKIGDEYIKERAADLRDVAKRLLGNLLGQNELNILKFNEKKVLVTDDLSPSDAAEIEVGHILGILTNRGGRTSHSVIMARSLQVPAVVGLHDITTHLTNDSYVIIDGYEGVVIVDPTPETLEKYEQIKFERGNVQKIFESVNHLSSISKDNVHLPLMVNIEGLQDVRRAQTVGADGVGLFRTEALYLRSENIPTEKEQFEVYRAVAEAISPKPITIRTLDLGGDKKLSGSSLTMDEVNPFMGVRAIRLCFDNPHIFKDQLRAILRASAFGNVRMMYPMISGVHELIQANTILEQVKQELRNSKIAFDEAMKVGSMIETPSAALTIDLLADHCEFFSIGTNDLIQYTLAVDRVNERIAHLYQPNHPSVLRILRMIIDSAHERNVEVGVCGEMAGDPLYASMLLGMGVDFLSMTSGSLPEIKYLIRNMHVQQAKELANQVIKEPDAFKILKTLRDFYLDQVGSVLG